MSKVIYIRVEIDDDGYTTSMIIPSPYKVKVENDIDPDIEIGILQLSHRVRNALLRSDIRTIKGLVEEINSNYGLFPIRSLGEIGRTEIYKKLIDMGFIITRDIPSSDRDLIL